MNNLKHLVTILLPLVLTLPSCKDDTGKDANGKLATDLINNPASANDKGQKEVPVFSFEETQFHFGEIKSGDIVTHDFKFKNTGNAPLVINSASGSCGCTIPEYSKDPIPQGKEGIIKVKFDSHNKSGMVAKTVTILANTIPNTKVLTISAEVITQKDKE